MNDTAERTPAPAPAPAPAPGEWFTEPMDRALLRDHAALFSTHTRREALVSTALRTRSFPARRVIAAGVAGSPTYEDLLERVRASVDDAASQLGDGAAPWLRALAQVMALQNLRDSDLHDASRLFDVARRLEPRPRWRPQEHLTIAQVHWALDDTTRLRDELPGLTEIRPEDRAFLEVDLEGATSGVGSAAWTARLDEVLGQHGVAPVELSASGATPFDRLAAPSARPATVEGPLISVVMSAYRPGPEIFTAVRSILDQTWARLELVVVDDASGPEYDAVLSAVESLDPRVRLLRQPVNRGTYAARNAGLDAATGELVTFQDSDDWSHPERLERQARPLLEDPAVHSTMSRSVRCTSGLVFQRLGYSTSRKNASSLMYRRAEILDRLGYFDTVRKGGDSEFIERLEAVRPGGQVVLDDQLAFVRMEAVSLSRSDFLPGWHHPSRYLYRQSYRFWHDRISEGADPYLPDAPARRVFPAPRAFLRGTVHETPDQPFDVVFAGDWRRYGGPQRSMVEEIRALAGRGLRLGVLQVDALRFAETGHRQMCRAVKDLIDDGTVEPVLLDEGRHVRLLVLRYPPVLEFPPSLPTNISVERLVVVANQVPVEVDGTDRRYVVEECARNARHLFGATPLWAPQGPLARAALVPETAPENLAGFDVPGIIPLTEWEMPRTRFRSDRPVLGRLSRDSVLKWPDSPETVLQAYPDDPSFDVRLMGGRKTLTRVLGDLPPGWLVYPQNELSAREFLHQIDFFVYFHHPVLREAFGRVILEALATGCVAVLPEHFRDVFDDAAVYCDPAEVRDVVARLYADPAAYRAQSRRGVDAVRRRFSHASYRELIAALLPTEVGTVAS